MTRSLQKAEARTQGHTPKGRVRASIACVTVECDHNGRMNNIQSTKHIQVVSTNDGSEFQDDVNELLRRGYVLLQVGFEIEHDDKGRVITPRIAVLGSDQPEPPKPEVRIGS